MVDVGGDGGVACYHADERQGISKMQDSDKSPTGIMRRAALIAGWLALLLRRGKAWIQVELSQQVFSTSVLVYSL